jgi:2-keto-4-pentenoate hydratase
MTPDQRAAAARSLRHAASSGTWLPPLRESHPDMDGEDAYAIQQINTATRVAQGRRIVGRKIGLTALAVQRQLGVDQPDFGTLLDDMVYGDAEAVPWATLQQPRIEAEIAFVLERDLAMSHPGLPDVVHAIGCALPALEIVGSRIAGWNIRYVDTVADNASSGAVVLGGVPRRLADFDPRLCGMAMFRRGEPVSTGAGAACLGHPLNAVVWLARTMVRLGTPLKAGDLVLSGALGPMVSVQPGDVLEARVHGLGSVKAVFDQAVKS